MSRGDSFDRGDFQARYEARPQASPSTSPGLSPASARTPAPVWPVPNPQIGQSVVKDRNGKGRPHKGVDLFVPAGTNVRAVRSGFVVRIIDGRQSTDSHKKRAGLFIDLLGVDGLLYRYLHLGSTQVRAGESIRAGQTVGTVADEGTSGTGERSHLHLEIRKSDWSNGAYGAPIDPLTVLKKK